MAVDLVQQEGAGGGAAKAALDALGGQWMALELARRVVARAGIVQAADAPEGGGGGGGPSAEPKAGRVRYGCSQVALLVFGVGVTNVEGNGGERHGILSIPSDWKVVRGLIEIYAPGLGLGAGATAAIATGLDLLGGGAGALGSDDGRQEVPDAEMVASCEAEAEAALAGGGAQEDQHGAGGAGLPLD
jgi:hypothetical protein